MLAACCFQGHTDFPYSKSHEFAKQIAEGQYVTSRENDQFATDLDHAYMNALGTITPSASSRSSGLDIKPYPGNLRGYNAQVLESVAPPPTEKLRAAALAMTLRSPDVEAGFGKGKSPRLREHSSETPGRTAKSKTLDGTVRRPRLRLVFCPPGTPLRIKTCVARRRPLGLAFRDTLPVIVQEATGHAQDLGIKPGWTLVAFDNEIVTGSYEKFFATFQDKLQALPGDGPLYTSDPSALASSTKSPSWTPKTQASTQASSTDLDFRTGDHSDERSRVHQSHFDYCRHEAFSGDNRKSMTPTSNTSQPRSNTSKSPRTPHISPGCFVKLTSLPSTQTNLEGHLGIVYAWCDQRSKWLVHMTDGECLAVPTNQLHVAEESRSARLAAEASLLNRRCRRDSSSGARSARSSQSSTPDSHELAML